MHVSEFGQKELVTVTPLESPGRESLRRTVRQDIPVPAGRGATASAAGGGMRTLNDTIVVQIDGKEIARAVNSRLFEMSDNLV